jgi:iron(III) transport system substrate-binding protein
MVFFSTFVFYINILAFLMRPSITIITLLIALFAISCNKNTNTVVVYTSVDQLFSEPILHDFEAETGIKIKAVYDTEETKSTGVLNRLIAEKNNPQCDVFWSGDPVRTIVLKSKNHTFLEGGFEKPLKGL